MIDPKLLRSSPDEVAANLARRGFILDVAGLRALEERRRAAQIEADRLRAERNATAKSVGQAKGKGEDVTALLAQGERLGHELVAAEAAINDVQAQLDELQLGLPNLLQDSVPDGRDEAANVELRRWGTPRELAFDPRIMSRWESALPMAWISRPARASPAQGSWSCAAQIARLHRALGQFMIDLHTREHGYTEVYVPYLASPASLTGTGPAAQVRARPVRGAQRAAPLPDSDGRSAG